MPSCLNDTKFVRIGLNIQGTIYIALYSEKNYWMGHLLKNLSIGTLTEQDRPKSIREAIGRVKATFKKVREVDDKEKNAYHNVRKFYKVIEK